MKKNLEKSVYFPGLYALRFIAAFAVIVTHIELYKLKWNLTNLYDTPIIHETGGLGVDFFFVLSGFLITYLLFFEEKKRGTISLKKFYLRRVFRIWPLYYLIVVVVFFILPFVNYPPVPGINIADDFVNRLLLFVFMLPNVSKSFYEFVPHGGMCWSVGVEEQFYIFWPVILKFSKNKLKPLLIVTFTFIGLKILFVMYIKLFGSFPFSDGISKLLAMTRIEIMGLGGIGAYLVFTKNSLLNIIYSKSLQILCYVSILPLILFFPKSIDDLIHIVFGIIFLIIILNISTNKNTILRLENPIFTFLGKISYGLYMYHMMIVGGFIYLVHKYSFFEGFYLLSNFLVYVLILGTTIIVSTISYYFFEKPFLDIKSKYTVITSGTDAKK